MTLIRSLCLWDGCRGCSASDCTASRANAHGPVGMQEWTPQACPVITSSRFPRSVCPETLTPVVLSHGRCRSTADVVAIVQLCSKHCVPLTPFAAGTSVEGHTTTPHGGISIDMTRMNVSNAVPALYCRMVPLGLILAVRASAPHAAHDMPCTLRPLRCFALPLRSAAGRCQADRQV